MNNLDLSSLGKNGSNPFLFNFAPLTEKTADKPKQDTLPIEDVTVEQPKEEAKPKEEPKQEAPKEDEPKKKKKRTKKAEDALDSVKQTLAADYDKDVCQIVYATEDPNWESLKKTIDNELSKIKVPDNLNEATMAVLAEDIDRAYDMIAKYYYDYAGVYSMLTDLYHGKIAFVKAMNSDGTNGDDRKRNAWFACTHYREGNKTVNLLDMANVTTVRLNYLKGALDRIKSKQSVMFTLSSSMKSR